MVRIEPGTRIGTRFQAVKTMESLGVKLHEDLLPVVFRTEEESHAGTVFHGTVPFEKLKEIAETIRTFSEKYETSKNNGNKNGYRKISEELAAFMKSHSEDRAEPAQMHP